MAIWITTSRPEANAQTEKNSIVAAGDSARCYLCIRFNSVQSNALSVSLFPLTTPHELSHVESRGYDDACSTVNLIRLVAKIYDEV